MLKFIADTITPYVVRLTNWLLSKFGTTLKAGDSFADAVNFFIYDTLKIIILLSFMIFVISFIRSFFPPEKVKKVLSKFNGVWAHIIASILGVLSPF